MCRSSLSHHDISVGIPPLPAQCGRPPTCTMTRGGGWCDQSSPNSAPLRLGLGAHGQLIGVLTTTGESALCAGHASRRLDMPGKALITQCSALPGLLCHIVVRTVTRRPHSQFPGLLTLARQHWIVQVFQLDFPRMAVETVQAWHDAFFRHDGSARLAFDDGH